MPTFLIFHYGSVIETVKGASPAQLYSAVEKAVKLAGPVSAPVYSTPGHKLGGGPTAGTSLSPALDLQKFLQSIVAFIALYFTTLFSLDAYAAAESSPFNIHKAVPESTRPRAGGAQAKPAGGASQSGRRLGTIADISGGN
jgi:thioredoxin 1